MGWLAVLAIVVLVAVSVVALRAVAGAGQHLGASLDRLGELRAATDSLATTVGDVAARGRPAGDANAAPTRP